MNGQARGAPSCNHSSCRSTIVSLSTRTRIWELNSRHKPGDSSGVSALGLQLWICKGQFDGTRSRIGMASGSARREDPTRDTPPAAGQGAPSTGPVPHSLWSVGGAACRRTQRRNAASLSRILAYATELFTDFAAAEDIKAARDQAAGDVSIIIARPMRRDGQRQRRHSSVKRRSARRKFQRLSTEGTRIRRGEQNAQGFSHQQRIGRR